MQLLQRNLFDIHFISITDYVYYHYYKYSLLLLIYIVNINVHVISFTNLNFIVVFFKLLSAVDQ